MELSSIKDAVRAARRLQLALSSGGALRLNRKEASHEEACDKVAEAMGYRNHAHLVSSFGSVEKPLPKVIKDLAQGSLMSEDIVEKVFPTVRGNAPPAHSLDWHRRDAYVDLDQNTPFLEALEKCPPGRAVVLMGDSYTGKSMLVANRVVGNPSRTWGIASPEGGGISFSVRTNRTPGSFASGILRQLDPKHNSRKKVSVKLDEMHRRIEEMPTCVMVLDDLHSIMISDGRLARETIETIASLVEGSRHRWVLVGIGSAGLNGRSGIDVMTGVSPRLVSLIESTVELKSHHGDDPDIERIARAWEKRLPIHDRGFFENAANRRKLMAAVGAPAGIGIVTNGLDELTRKLAHTTTPTDADMSDLLDAMIAKREKEAKESAERAEKLQKERQVARAEARKRKATVIGTVTIAELLSMESDRGKSGHTEYWPEDGGFLWSVETHGLQFTCQVEPDRWPTGTMHTLTIRAVNRWTKERTGSITVDKGVVTIGKGNDVCVLDLDFETSMIPGWTEYGWPANHAALAAAVAPMLEDKPLGEELERELRSLVRILRDATGGEGAVVTAATAVTSQRVSCQYRPASKVDLGAVRELIIRDYPALGWRNTGSHDGEIEPIRIRFSQWRDPKPQSSLDSIERRIRDNLPGCSAELRDAILDLHARMAERNGGEAASEGGCP